MIVGEDNEELKEHLLDEMDYKLVPEDVWDFLVSIYGLSEGQEPISRYVSCISYITFFNTSLLGGVNYMFFSVLY